MSSEIYLFINLFFDHSVRMSKAGIAFLKSVNGGCL